MERLNLMMEEMESELYEIYRILEANKEAMVDLALVGPPEDREEDYIYYPMFEGLIEEKREIEAVIRHLEGMQDRYYLDIRNEVKNNQKEEK